MRAAQPAIFLVAISLLAGACGGAGNYTARKEIEGNNTGGSIPVGLLAGKNAQSLADAHCGRWGTRARITFDGTASGGDTVFVCEGPSGPAMLAPQTPAAPGTQTAPASQQAPLKR